MTALPPMALEARSEDPLASSPRRRPQPPRLGLGRAAAIAVAVMASLAGEVDARSITGRKSDVDGTEHISVTFLIFLWVAMVCGGGICWCLYLEGNPSAGSVRLVMCGMLAVATSFELSCCAGGVLRWWVAIVITGANVWGSLDAILRYPVEHDIDTIFTLKQITLLCAKIIAYVFGFSDLSRTLSLFFALILINIVSLPLLYFLALPVEDAEHNKAFEAKANVVDVDLLWRVGKLLLDPEERRRCAMGFRRRARSMKVQIASLSPTAEHLLCRHDASYKECLSPRRRRV